MMFDRRGRSIRRYAAGLAILSLVSLLVTVWSLRTIRREQAIVEQLINHLRGSDLAVANELSGDLNLQSSLLVLLVLNILGAAAAFVLVWRGYLSSQRSLQDARVLSTDILASMDAGVITTDKNGRITSINPSGCVLIGSAQNLVGQRLSEIDPQHGLLDSICTEISSYHRPVLDRDYLVTRNGQTQMLRAGCTLLSNRDNEQIGMVFHVRDVTEKALMEDRLRRMERYMGLGSLAAGLQHEIKNPLSALSLHIQLLCERLDETTYDAEVAELLDILNTEVKRISEVLDGFRSYASVQQLGRSPVDVPLVIEKLVRLLRPQAEQQKVKLKVDTPSEPVGLIMGDQSRLEQVFLNLALNGVSAMPSGGELRFRLCRQEDHLRVDVTDEGHGIPLGIQSKIFDPYFTTRGEGTGMGLALCDKIIRQHEGEIDFETGTNGTTFTVLLPV